MVTTYQLNSSELTEDFIRILKETYKNKFITISVSENVNEVENDGLPEFVLDRIYDIENNRNIIVQNSDTTKVHSITGNNDIYELMKDGYMNSREEDLEICNEY